MEETQMADDPIGLTRERFNRLDAKLDRLLELQETTTLRLSSMEQKLAHIGTDIARIDARLDGFEKRLARIEKRFDLIEAWHCIRPCRAISPGFSTLGHFRGESVCELWDFRVTPCI
jgi:hypothetical protein